MRIAYRCRAYPDQAQQAVLNRTFGCVRVVWNRTLAARQDRWQTERTGARPVAPGMTGTSTPPRTSLRQVVP